MSDNDERLLQEALEDRQLLQKRLEEMEKGIDELSKIIKDVLDKIDGGVNERPPALKKSKYDLLKTEGVYGIDITGDAGKNSYRDTIIDHDLN